MVLGPLAKRVPEAAVKSLTKGAGLASWFKKWAAIEEVAISLYAHECRAIPGLLQPEPYLRAIFDRRLPHLREEEIEQQVVARLERLRLMTERPNSSFSFIVEQALLERGLGGREVTRAVIERLLETGAQRNVENLLMPLHQEDLSGFEGPLYLAETPDHQWIGYFEGHDSSTLLTSPKLASSMLQRYGKMRSQALNCQATVSLLEQRRGAL